MDLNDLGWNSFFEASKKQILQNLNNNIELKPARIIKEEKQMYKALNENGEVILKITGKMLYNADSKLKLPKVGDWVIIQQFPNSDTGLIHEVLDRKTVITRQAASCSKNIGLNGVLSEQVLAANIDTVFCVTGLDHNFSPQRIERYLIAVWEAGANPVVVLNKSDICDESELRERIEEVEKSVLAVPVYAVSAVQDSGIELLKKHLKSGETAIFIGSSGVGKSSLINRLLNYEKQQIKSVRGKDSHGMHTTTHRELFILDNGGIVIDTPGMREFQIWADVETFGNAFDDIETLSKMCRFKNCTHRNEPGCAVQNAVETGELDQKRLISYHKLEKEMNYFDLRKRNKDRINERESKQKQLSKDRKRFKSKYYSK